MRADNPYAPPRDELCVFVPGRPAPQGSKRHVGNGVLVESSARVKPWRQDVREAALAAGVRLAGPVSVGLRFYLPRPKRPTHPDYPAGPPDLDKLVRAVLDALTSASTFEDDARVVDLHASKNYVTQHAVPGCRITVRKWTP